MKERLQHHLSDVGESFDYLRSDVRNLSRYMAELEALVERYRTFFAHATLSTPTDQAEIARLLKKTLTVLGPPPDEQPALPTTTDDRRTKRAALTRGNAGEGMSLERVTLSRSAK